MRRSLPYAVAALLFIAYGANSVLKHRRMHTTGFDLGIFEQVVRAYAELRAPVAELKGPGFHILGDHFHPILVLLAPLYRMFPSPLTLLLAQAALFAAAAIPLTRLAVRVTGAWPGAAIGPAYGLAWGVQTAVDFDFHEICFALPLLSLSLCALVEQRWRFAAAVAAPLVLVREDMTLVVAAIGLYLVLHRQRRLGWAVAAYGVCSAALVYFVLVPAFNAAGEYGYFAFGAPNGQAPWARLASPFDIKAQTVLTLLAPTLLLALRSPIVLLALPSLAIRFWSTEPNHWSDGFHYNAIPALICFVAFVDALRRMEWRRHVPAAAATMSLAYTVFATSTAPLTALADPGAWRPGTQAVAARQVLGLIPDGAHVAAANRLSPQLTSRATVYAFPDYPNATLQPEWLVFFDSAEHMTPQRYQMALSFVSDSDYRVVTRREGIILMRLGAGAGP